MQLCSSKITHPRFPLLPGTHQDGPCSHQDHEEGSPGHHGEVPHVPGHDFHTNKHCMRGDHHNPQQEALKQGSGLCHTSDEGDSQRPHERNLDPTSCRKRRGQGETITLLRSQSWVRRSLKVILILRRC